MSEGYDPRRDGRCLHAPTDTPVIPGRRGYVCAYCQPYVEDEMSDEAHIRRRMGKDADAFLAMVESYEREAV